MEALNSFLKNKNRYGYSGIIVYDTIFPDFFKKNNGSVWFNADGMHISYGSSARQPNAEVYSWGKIEGIIRRMIENGTYMSADEISCIDEIEEKPDFIVLDPPRDGIHPKALPKIIEYQVDNLVYISCKPTSLARDLEIFLRRGYRVERCVCVDQFAQTVHTETICHLKHTIEKQ